MILHQIIVFYKQVQKENVYVEIKRHALCCQNMSELLKQNSGVGTKEINHKHLLKHENIIILFEK